MEKPPWTRGSGQNGTTFVLEIYVHVDPNGGVQSYRTLQTDQDLEIAKNLQNGGLEYASFSLLQEALRQECLFQALLLLTEKKELNPETLQWGLESVIDRYVKAVSESVVNQTIDSLSHERRE